MTDAQASAVSPCCSSIDDLRHAYIEAVNSNKARKVAKLWVKGGVLMPPGMPAIEGRSAIESFYAKLFEQSTVTIGIHSLQQIHYPDYVLGIDRGEWWMQAHPKNAAQDRAAAFPLKYVTVCQRVGECWQVSINIWNENPLGHIPVCNV